MREFLPSRDPKKREKLIDALIASPEFVDYWTFRFDDVFRVSVSSNGISPSGARCMPTGSATASPRNKPYARWRGNGSRRRATTARRGTSFPYDVIGPPGETMAEEVRVFFGRRLDCAQCHNHPYEAWSQDQFWGLAAFFGRMFKMGDTGFEYVIFDHPLDQPMGNGDVNGSLKMLHPRTKAELKPTLLDGTVIECLRPRESAKGARRLDGQASLLCRSGRESDVELLLRTWHCRSGG